MELMDQMSEMYKSFAEKYDNLIKHEDYQNNLSDFLKKNIDWKDKSVYEFGAGTGRVTQYYIDEIKKATIFDNSEAMLEAAKNKLDNSKLTISKFDNTQIHTLEQQVDIVIEGWSFGHLVVEKKDELYTWLKYLDSNIKRLAKQHVVIIETMGTNVNIPTVTNTTLKKMYLFLEENGYKKNIVKTDYKFETHKQAAVIMGSFFGDEMEKDIQKKQQSIIQEYTGVWIYTPITESKIKITKKKYLFNL
jgi:ubiquinone/menaquinone biosynthesis C-methylase UbiE